MFSNTNEAVSTGNIEILKETFQSVKCWDIDTCTTAAKKGYIECLEFAHKNGCPWNIWVSIFSAANGHLKCLRYAHKNGCPFNEAICMYAAAFGQLECLKYAHENGFQWDRCTCANAAKNNRLDCLRYAYENGCVCDEWVLFICVKSGSLDCLEYLLKKKCPYNDKIFCTQAVENGQLKCVKYLITNNYIKKDILPCILIEVLRKNKCEFCEQVPYIDIWNCAAYLLKIILKWNIQKLSCILHENDNYKITKLFRYVQCKRKVEKICYINIFHRVHKRINIYKKELIASTWHPTRFIHWCLDIEEKKELQEDIIL